VRWGSVAMRQIEMNTVPFMPSKQLALAVSPLHISPIGATLVFSRFSFGFMMFGETPDLHQGDTFLQYSKGTP